MRSERVTRELKVTRLFTTLVEELKVIGNGRDGPGCAQRPQPAVLLLMGGGMGAGKSTVLKQIMKE